MYYRTKHIHVRYEAVTKLVSYYGYNTHNVHRCNKPSLIYISGSKYFCVNNAYHNLYGPSLIYPDGTSTYWIYDEDFANIQTYTEKVKKYGL